MPSWQLPHVTGTFARNTRLAGVVLPLDVVEAVAVAAVGRGQEAGAAERLAVDAVLELRDDVADGDAALLDDLGVAVAAAAGRRAGSGDTSKSRGLSSRESRACRGSPCMPPRRWCVDARRACACTLASYCAAGCIVAGRAVDGRKLLRVRELRRRREVGVAGDARLARLAVNRGGELLGRDRHRAPAGARERRVAVAGQAIVVGRRLRRRRLLRQRGPACAAHHAVRRNTGSSRFSIMSAQRPLQAPEQPSAQRNGLRPDQPEHDKDAASSAASLLCLKPLNLLPGAVALWK